MELVAGGTLQDRVQQSGPLPVTQAVDMILQVINGLEAAAAIGVLHRDVKPSNCFIEPEGTVKVGDFGLSISTLARAETNLTVAGAFLGTPAYCSPEQLRGEALDVRSDIYAVGVTLYYLLIGQTPFADDNMVKLLATVLERPAESPKKLRAEIPDGLAKVILRCLAKQKEQRFKTYEQLRQALALFDSTASVPAPLALRFCAGLLDVAFVSLLLVILEELARNLGWNFKARSWVQGGFVMILYYGISEGLWSASLGKAICRLRVTGRDRDTPGLPRAFLRFFVYWAAFRASNWAFQGLGLLASHPIPLSRAVALLVLFCTARRKNGFAALHDLASGTRVVRKREFKARNTAASLEEIPANVNSSEQIGPYQVLSSLRKSDKDELLLGFDPLLLRKVWIRKLPPGAPPEEKGRRNLGRPGRLRWLTGKRSEGETWDAYEAPSGQRLQWNTPQPWQNVRYWLHDLAEELAVGLKDGSLPGKISLDRIWITNDGRAKLLDFPAPGIDPKGDDEKLSDAATAPLGGYEAQLFLKQATSSVLLGRIVAPDEIWDGPVAAVLPLQARTFLSRLPGFSSLEAMTSELAVLLNQPASVRFRTRLLIVLGCSAPILFFLFMELVSSGQRTGSTLRLIFSSMTLLVALFSMIAAVDLRGGLLMRAARIAFVTRTGSPASQERLLLRSLVAWLPVILFYFLRLPFRGEGWVWVVTFGSLAALTIVSLLLPQRGLPDRIVGTWPVPL